MYLPLLGPGITLSTCAYVLIMSYLFASKSKMINLLVPLGLASFFVVGVEGRDYELKKGAIKGGGINDGIMTMDEAQRGMC